MARIVVGVDGSESALRALEWALDEARLRGASVHAIHAWDAPPVAFTGPATIAPYEWDDSGLVESLEQALDEWVPEVADAEVTREVSRGSAAGALVDASEDADLVVVGSRGPGHLRGALLGWVASGARSWRAARS